MVVWLALAFFVAALAAGIAHVVLRALVAWRQLKRTGGAFSAEASRIASVVDGIPAHFERMNASVERLRAQAARIQASRARLDVQLRALAEARLTMRRLLWFVPGV